MEGNTRDRRPKQHCLPPPQPYPWLLYFNGKGEKNQTFCTISDPTKTYSRSIPELGASKLLTVQHGWCLLANSIPNGSQLFLWNPSNFKKFKLPTLTHNATIGDCILSSPPTATDQVCSIFLVSYPSSSIFHCQLGNKHWTEVDYPEDLVKTSVMGETVLINPVYCNGSLCVLLPTLPPARFRCIRQLLASNNNELFRIEILHEQNKVIAVAVHRFDFSQRVWEKVESIKDRVLFISSVGPPFACQAIDPETEGGRIYIALGRNNFVYIYNIEDNTLMISQPFSNLPKKRSYSRWFMSDVRMSDLLKEEIGKAQIREKESTCAAIHLKETGDTATNESALPLDVGEAIAKRLNVVDYLHFRATNRLFRLGAPPIQWRSFSPTSMSRFDDVSLSPLFVCLEKDKVLTFVHPKHGLKYKYTINLPEDCNLKANSEISNLLEAGCEMWYLKAGCEICYSKDGWLLLAVNTYTSFFFNPFTKQVLPLPCGPGTVRNTRCVGFSHPPTSYDCVIIEFVENKLLHNMKAHITFLGEDKWWHFTFEDSNFPLDNVGPAFHKGAFYYLSKKGKLGVIEVTEEEVIWEELEKLQAPCTGYFNSFLVECNGNLLSVFEGHCGKWVRVFKLNESKMTWIKVDNLENHMLFVGHTSLSAVANIPGMENKIYFPRFYGQSILFYSLETNKYHTFENEVVNFHGVREQLNSSWIEPRWH